MKTTECTLKLSVYYTDSNQPLNLATLTALAGARPALGSPTSILEGRLLLKDVEE
jgi:hypothetical protein